MGYKKVYGFDIDGCLTDFLNAFRMWLNDALPVFLDEHEITSYYWYETTDISKEDFFTEFDKFGIEGHGYRHLKLLDGAKECLQRIHDAGHEIHYITNRPQYALQDTIDYFKEHEFPQSENLHFACGSKSPLIRELNIDVFIEDSPSTLEDITINTRATIYCRDYQYNRHLDDSLNWWVRVGSLNEFMEIEGI